MKILIIAQYFPPDITAAAFRMFDTARLLEDNGHEVRVITAQPHRSQVDGDSTAGYDAQISGVLRTRVAHLNRGGFAHYIKHYVSFMVGSSWLGLKQRLTGWDPEVIWASSPPLFVGLSGVALSRVFGAPLVLDIRDIWPASAVGAGQLSAQGRAYRFGEKMERYVYDKAAHITCVARPMAEYIRTKTTKPVTVVYNGTKASDIVIHSEAGNGSENGRTLLYAGHLGRAQQLDLLIRAWANVRGRNGHRRWTMKLLGTGAVEKELKELVSSLGVSDSVVFVPPLSRQDAMREMTRAAALSVSLQPDKVFEKTIPSKVFDCMAAGRPVLGGLAGEGREILESTGANVCYRPGDQDDLEHSLERLMRDYKRLRLVAYRNPQVVRSTFTRERAVATLMSVFDSATSDGHSVPVMESPAGGEYADWSASPQPRPGGVADGSAPQSPRKRPDARVHKPALR
jgi:glycosyltransferase involved in cell wall biosynthesis